MKTPACPIFKWSLLLSLAALVALIAGCGGGSSSSPGPGPSNVSNQQTIQVNPGPAGNYTNGLFTDVKICIPGTSNCQTLTGIEVDTGSEGLRILSSALTLNLPSIENSSGNPLQECATFADGSYLWGPVQTANIQIAGEKASSVPVQVVSASPSFPVPSKCLSGGGGAGNTVAALGANGILGIGNFRQDCGSACTSSSSSVPALYYLCPNSVCQVTSVSLANQMQNPVWLFPQDNNGVLVSLPSIPDTGATTATGSLIFGIGTQSDNSLGSAQVYTTDASGSFQTTYSGVAYPSFLDTGSNGLYFLDSTTLGVPDSSKYPGFYCPSSTISYTVTNTGLNGISAPVSFKIACADLLFAGNGGSNWAFNDLGGDSGTSPSTDYFDFGIPFFYGRNVFVGIEGQSGPSGIIGPYWAY